jgi:outer membrane protein assembly factor BamB
MFQYNAQHTGQSPYSAVSNPALKWVKNYGVGGFPSYSGVPSSYRTVSPVIGSDGTIYMVFQNRSGLLAIWPDGNIRWRLNFCCSAGDDVIFSTERILYATSGANLLAINPLDGSVISNKTAPFGNEANPLQIVDIANDGTVYVEDVNYNIQAVNQTGGLDAFYTNGTLKWHYPIPSLANKFANTASIGQDGTIYFALSGSLYAMNPNGTLKWSYKGNYCGWTGAIAIGQDGTIYCFGGGAEAISPVNGNKIWNADLPAVGAGVALAKNGTLYFAGGDYDPEGCGEPGWIMSVLTNGTYVNDIEQLGCHGIPSSPLVGSDGTVYAAIISPYTPESYRGFCSDGNLCLNFTLPESSGRPMSAIAMSANGTIYFADGYNIYAFGQSSAS